MTFISTSPNDACQSANGFPSRVDLVPGVFLQGSLEDLAPVLSRVTLPDHVDALPPHFRPVTCLVQKRKNTDYAFAHNR